jgi:hypothetical protein
MVFRFALIFVLVPFYATQDDTEIKIVSHTSYL